MALIELHLQLKETNSLLERIARGVERLLLEEYSVRMGHCVEPAADPHPEVEPSVAYHTDTDTLRNDLQELAGRLPPDDDEMEPFGV